MPTHLDTTASNLDDMIISVIETIAAKHGIIVHECNLQERYFDLEGPDDKQKLFFNDLKPLYFQWEVLYGNKRPN